MTAVFGGPDAAGAAMASPDPRTDKPEVEKAAGPQPEPAWLPVERPVEALVEDVSLVAPGGRILIFCGEASPSIYNDHRFLDVARAARHFRGAKIEVITGPVLLVPEACDQTNGLLMLWQEGMISELYHRRARYATNHFRVVETDLNSQKAYRYYAETPHRPLEAVDRRHCENLSRLHPADVHQRALQAVSLFDSWKTQATRHGTKDFEMLPLLATSCDLRTMLAEAAEQKLVFKYLDERELLSLDGGRGLLTPYPQFPPLRTNGTHDGHR